MPNDLSGQPVMEQQEPLIDFYYHKANLPRPFSIRWSGSLIVLLAGTYKIWVEALSAGNRSRFRPFF